MVSVLKASSLSYVQTSRRPAPQRSRYSPSGIRCAVTEVATVDAMDSIELDRTSPIAIGRLSPALSMRRGSIPLSGLYMRSPTMVREMSNQEMDLIAEKLKLVKQWVPEYSMEEVRPPQDTPDVHSERATNVTLAMVLKEQQNLARKTKIICTAGPACWSEDGLGKLLDAGMNILRFNFSHGDHKGHLEVLERFRMVCEKKGSRAAALLDTKGPEIRTAMLRDHKPISLEAGQSIIVESVGDRYTEFEGYKDEKETRIGLSYAKLCQSVKPGNKILLADGSLSIQVDEIVSATELRGTVLNSKSLGERKNGNLPGIKVDIPVLTDKDIDDLQNFCVKHQMDYVAASFVQTAADVQFIRRVLDEAGGQHVKIICKIENMEGLINFDEILAETDGIMVARGDLGMEIPSEKVPLAQKMMITKCNIAGKPVICATQMLESMISSPRPTRAEMTDVANAVYDGVDCVMLSGESANGEFPDLAVSTMAAIVANAEIGVDYYSQYSFIRYWTTKGNVVAMPPVEAILSSAASMAVGFTEDTTPEQLRSKYTKTDVRTLIACATKTGSAAALIAKYRPPCPIVVVSTDDQVLRQCAFAFGMIPLKVESLDLDSEAVAKLAADAVGKFIEASMTGSKVIVALGCAGGDADVKPFVSVVKLRGLSAKDKTFSFASNPLPSSMVLQRSGTRSMRSTFTNLALITKPVTSYRNTHIICTMGPKCWSEETLGKLLDAGMDIIRLNFSHGDHKSHLEVLERFRKVAKAKGQEFMAKGKMSSPPQWGTLLDTKGPEIRTAMLRDHKPISLEAGQSIIVEAVGDRYTEFEGYKDDKETRIGLSYAKLCQSVKPGKKILLADGTISIQVDEILSATELRGTVLNSKSLGERKNGNLPGVKVDIPVLTDKDIDDLQNFCAKHELDYVAASFVQSAADVRFIRRVLDAAGALRVKIISKIENAAGMENYDEILRESDGIMVARGDLGMEIPAEKVPLAQKMMITKANIAGKFVVTATQMLESMITNPRPTRAEMTDVANAVLDGTDCVMLSGETANGDFPVDAVATMSAICRNAEEMVNDEKRYDFIRNQTPKPMSGAEALCSGAVQAALDCDAKAIICITSSGRAPALVSKYKPSQPVFVVTPDEQLIRHCRSAYGQEGIFYENVEGKSLAITEYVAAWARGMGLIDLQPGDHIIVIKRRNIPAGCKNPYDDQRLIAKIVILGNAAPPAAAHTAYPGKSIIYHRSTKIGLGTLLNETDPAYVRKTKIICTAGPACWSEDGLGKLLDAGMDILRFNFSHGDQKGHLEVLERFRKVVAQKKVHAGALLDTKGPEIRTAMLRDHKPISLEAGQQIIVEAVGARYTEFEGYKDGKETRIGLSYDKLCQSVKPGNKILLADGSISITVEEVLSATELRGTVLNSKSLGERKNCNLPGVKVEIPVLTEKDIDDLQNFCAKHQMDYVAASFVQSKADVEFIRRVLDEAGGQHVKIICKIENGAGLQNFDEILEATDGIMVARGDLGMEIPVEKVPLAQKMMITKANISGKFIVTATQMMESMITNPIATRAEMTDVANAVFDGTDCVMLSGESANGAYPDLAVSTMAKICKCAEIGVNHYQTQEYIRSFTPKPVSALEATMCSLAKNAVDTRPGLIIVFSETGKSARLIAKYRPCAPVLLVTSNAKLARTCSSLYALHPLLMSAPIQTRAEIQGQVEAALEYAVDKGLCPPGKEVIIMTSTKVAAGEDLARSSLRREIMVTVAPGQLEHKTMTKTLDPKFLNRTLSLRSTIINLDMLFEDHAPVRKTKIIVTIGPSSSSPELLERLVDEGMDVAMFRFTHGEKEDHCATLALLRQICAAKGRTVAIMLDLQGPEVRTSYLIDRNTLERIEKLELKAGEPIMLYGTDDLTEQNFVGYRSNTGIVRLGVDLLDFVDVVRPGSVVHLRDGAIGIRIDSVTRSSATGVVLNSGSLGERKVVQIDGISVFNTVSSEGRDLQDISDFAVDHGVDFVAVGKVRSRSEINELRHLLDNIGCDSTKIIAKIETTDGLRNLDDIIEDSYTDAVMVARGNLGMEIACEKIALAQCNIIAKCKVAGKPVIISRHMLESMNTNPRPTRAEMTDVANAVLDSADCIMLCSETATGTFPVESLTTASRICRNAEAAMNYGAIHSFIRDFSAKPFSTLTAASVALAKACMDAQVELAIVVSNCREAAQVVTKFRPNVPVVVITSQSMVAAQCNIAFGQRGFVVDAELFDDSTQEASMTIIVSRAVAWARTNALLSSSNSRVALMHGYETIDTTATSATIKIMDV